MSKCPGCQFYDAAGEGTDGAGNKAPVGFCMRYPPQITPTGASSFPIVGEKNWCGEFRQAEQPATKAKTKGVRR